MRSPSEFAVDAVLAEMTGVRGSDVIQDTLNRFRMNKLSNGVERQLVKPGVQVRNGNRCRLKAKNQIPIQIGKVVRANGRSEFHSTCTSVHPFANGIVGHLRVDGMVSPCKKIWQEKGNGQGWDKKDIIHSNYVTTRGLK